MNTHYGVVSQRANHCCEYCHAPESVFNFPFEVEHIIPVALKGINQESNLALACRSCNLCKGARIVGYLSDDEQEVRFFHPRKDEWIEHFSVSVSSGSIIGLTNIGTVTVNSLKMNSTAQVTARKLWIQLGLFP